MILQHKDNNTDTDSVNTDSMTYISGSHVPPINSVWSSDVSLF